MKVKGVRLYGVKDIRLEEFEIPEIAEDEILLKIECNGIAVSTKRDHIGTETFKSTKEY